MKGRNSRRTVNDGLGSVEREKVMLARLGKSFHQSELHRHEEVQRRLPRQPPNLLGRKEAHNGVDHILGDEHPALERPGVVDRAKNVDDELESLHSQHMHPEGKEEQYIPSR